MFTSQPFSTDPEPFVLAFDNSTRLTAEDAYWTSRMTAYQPRPEYRDYSKANPILVAARENWDNDPWAQALTWLDALTNYMTYEGPGHARECDASPETITVLSLMMSDEWDLPRATVEHVEHAFRVFDKIAAASEDMGLPS